MADTPRRIELICPAGSLPALRAAVDNGADGVYIGLKDDTNARNFPGLNFTPAEMSAALGYAQERGAKVLLAINTYPQARGEERWLRAIDAAASMRVDAVILADPGLMDYAASKHPGLRLHLSVQGSATSYEAIDFYQRRFGIRARYSARVVAAGAHLNIYNARTLRFFAWLGARRWLVPVEVSHDAPAEIMRADAHEPQP